MHKYMHIYVLLITYRDSPTLSIFKPEGKGRAIGKKGPILPQPGNTFLHTTRLLLTAFCQQRNQNK